MNMLSAGCNGLMKRTGKPDAKAFTSVVVKCTLLPGLEINEKSRITLWLFLYFNPNHKRRVDMLSGVTATGRTSGPATSPFLTEEMKPSLYKPKAICKCNRLNGTEVVAKCTFVQFFKCEAKFAKWTNDMVKHWM